MAPNVTSRPVIFDWSCNKIPGFSLFWLLEHKNKKDDQLFTVVKESCFNQTFFFAYAFSILCSPLAPLEDRYQAMVPKSELRITICHLDILFVLILLPRYCFAVVWRTYKSEGKREREREREKRDKDMMIIYGNSYILTIPLLAPPVICCDNCE
jgi:hypothetical protein